MNRLLIIDSDRTTLSALTQSLEAAGYSVDRSLTVVTAREALREARHDLVLLGLEFGRDEGWGLLNEAVAGGMRVIVLSRGQSSADMVRALQAGATDYVAKPYRSEELLARVAVRLQQSPPAPEVPSSASTAQKTAGLPVELTPPPIGTPGDLAFALEPTQVPQEPPAEAARPPLGQRWRNARKSRNISLVQANLETKIQMYYIQALEEEKYALLPRGAAAVDIVRAYAAFLGEEPESAVAEFRALHPAEDEGPRDLAGQPVVRARRWPLLVGLLLIALLTFGLTCGGLALIFPEQTGNLVTNVRGIFSAPTATPPPPPTLTATPTFTPTLTPTASPTATPPPTPTLTATPTLAPTAVVTGTPTLTP